MFLPLALLLIHPQMTTKISLPAEKSTFSESAAISASAIPAPSENFATALTASPEAEARPADEFDATLPDAPTALEVMAPPAPMAFLNPGNPMKVSVEQLIKENRRKELMWKGLVIASSSAATFDALSTRHAIATYGAQELNPLLKPFAGNSSLFVAIQVGPALLDYAGRKMMYSRHSWVRHMWWVPQSASFVSSIFCGARNLSYR